MPTPNSKSDIKIEQSSTKTFQQQRSALEGAAGFLAQLQLEALKKMQEQIRTLNKAGLKMSKSMMAK